MTDCDKGPEGCNLFVFHIPNDMTNLDLYQMFSAFGTVRRRRHHAMHRLMGRLGPGWVRDADPPPPFRPIGYQRAYHGRQGHGA
jgi:hypothetical protein